MGERAPFRLLHRRSPWLLGALLVVACSSSRPSSPDAGGNGGSIAGSGGGAGNGGLAGSGGGGSAATGGAAGSSAGTAGTGGAAGSSAGTAGAGGMAGSASNCSSHDIDVPETIVSVSGAPGVPENGAVTLNLRNAAGDDALLAAAAGGSYASLMVPGVYDLYYGGVGPGIPSNSAAKLLSSVTIGSRAVALNVSVPATPVSGTITVNGAQVPSANGDGYLYLRNAAGDDLTLGTTGGGGTYSKLVVPGSYDIYYQLDSAGPGVPVNNPAKLQTAIAVGNSALSLNVDVRAVPVSGMVTVNGTKVTQASVPGGLYLKNAGGDYAPLATIPAAGPYTTLVVPGSYDLYYQSLEGPPPYPPVPPPMALPPNTMAKLQSGIVVGSSALALDIDIPTTIVSGTITVNGAQIPQANGYGNLSFRNAAGDSALIATTAVVGAYSTPVVPGTYDLYYTGGSGAGLPLNGAAKLKSGIIVGSSAVALDIEVGATVVSGMITVNGAQVPQASGRGNLLLRNAGGDKVLIGTTAIAGAYSTLVVSGTYDLYYQSSSGTGLLPYNTSARLRSGIVVGTAPLALDIDVPTATVSGTITANGGQFPLTTSGLAHLILHGSDGDTATLGSASLGAYSAVVIPGAYELYYSSQIAGDGLPSNTLADLGCFSVP